jgi:transcriptional/translational regulatory protein YebC/TACO1
VKHVFSKHGGNVGSSGSVAWQFNHWGAVRLRPPQNKLTEEQELALIEAGATEIERGEGDVVVYGEIENVGRVQSVATQLGIGEAEAQLEWVPKATVKPDDPAAVISLLEALEKEDDVNDVYTNADV